MSITSPHPPSASENRTPPTPARLVGGAARGASRRPRLSPAARARLAELGRQGQRITAATGSASVRVAAGGKTALVAIPIRDQDRAVAHRSVDALRAQLKPATARLIPGARAQLGGGAAEDVDFTAQLSAVTPGGDRVRAGAHRVGPHRGRLLLTDVAGVRGPVRRRHVRRRALGAEPARRRAADGGQERNLGDPVGGPGADLGDVRRRVLLADLGDRLVRRRPGDPLDQAAASPARAEPARRRADAHAQRRARASARPWRAQGRTNAAIARELVVTPGAVEKHVSNIFQKLDLSASDDDHRRVLAVLT